MVGDKWSVWEKWVTWEFATPLRHPVHTLLLHTHKKGRHREEEKVPSGYFWLKFSLGSMCPAKYGLITWMTFIGIELDYDWFAIALLPRYERVPAAASTSDCAPKEGENFITVVTSINTFKSSWRDLTDCHWQLLLANQLKKPHRSRRASCSTGAP